MLDFQLLTHYWAGEALLLVKLYVRKVDNFSEYKFNYIKWFNNVRPQLAP